MIIIILSSGIYRYHLPGAVVSLHCYVTMTPTVGTDGNLEVDVRSVQTCIDLPATCMTRPRQSTAQNKHEHWSWKLYLAPQSPRSHVTSQTVLWLTRKKSQVWTSFVWWQFIISSRLTRRKVHGNEIFGNKNVYTVLTMPIIPALSNGMWTDIGLNKLLSKKFNNNSIRDFSLVLRISKWPVVVHGQLLFHKNKTKQKLC